MAIHPTTTVPPALAQIAVGRDHIQTSEFARATNRVSQTLRKNYCLTGHCFGIRPVKFGNRLLWPVADIAKLLNGGSAND
ncbi:hypothetical protein F2P46_17400 [Massilia sp. CCM 8734]|nr:hypothetical protein [Massilia sp. CCM 8734]